MFRSKYKVIIIGRPNVGKSKLFNRIVGRNHSIVYNQPGTTRDIVTCTINNSFLLMDTAGINIDNELLNRVINNNHPLNIAIRSADIIIFVTDCGQGFTLIDKEISNIIRCYNKPIIHVMNKVDICANKFSVNKISGLSINKEPIFTSAENGNGCNKLLKVIEFILNRSKKNIEFRNLHKIKFCMVGKPNVGKSSLMNKLVKGNRSIISKWSGTTRDMISEDIEFSNTNNKSWNFEITDTAGLQQVVKLKSKLNYLSNTKIQSTISNSDVVAYIIDCHKGVSKVDKKVINNILLYGKGLILVVSKWDKILKRINDHSVFNTEIEIRKHFKSKIKNQLNFLPDIHISFTSVFSETSSKQLLYQTYYIHNKMLQPIATSKINIILQKLVHNRKPYVVDGRIFKIFYALQANIHPPIIKAFCNSTLYISSNYFRYLEKGLNYYFKIQGYNLQLKLFDKNRKDEV